MSHSTANIPVNQKNIKESDSKRLLKTGIWVYFLLLIFEGAMRKWLLPSLSNQLLIVRDPIAIWLIIASWRKGLFPSSIYLSLMVMIGFVSIFIAIFIGHGNLWVAIYGARIFLIHFPVIFIIGKVFNHEDVIKIGKIALWLSLPMTILIGLQFFSPQSSWVNRGVGGDMEGAGFSGALGYLRPPGTFSFTNGIHLFFGFVSPFILYFWFFSKNINRLLLIMATISLLAAIPLSISRNLFFHVIISMIFALIAISKKPKMFSKMIMAGVTIIICFMLLSKASFFQTSMEAFSDRYESATAYEGGIKGVLGNRYLGGMLGALTVNRTTPFFGYGIGMGTSVGAVLLQGEPGLPMGEDEWLRLIGELGFLLGVIVILIRLSFCLKLSFQSYKRLEGGDFLPWMLLSFALLTIPQGQWAQPTFLGFSIMIGGLVLAAMKGVNKYDKKFH